MVCGNLQLCAGLEAGMESAIHAMGQRKMKRARQRRRGEKARIIEEEDDEDEVADILEVSLDMEVHGEGKRE